MCDPLSSFSPNIRQLLALTATIFLILSCRLFQDFIASLTPSSVFNVHVHHSLLPLYINIIHRQNLVESIGNTALEGFDIYLKSVLKMCMVLCAVAHVE
jgi:hypothetical protein